MNESLIHPGYTPQINAHIARLEALTPLVRTVVNLPGADVRLAVIHPVSIDNLLDDAAHDPELNLPYWAEIWPSGIVLASAILEDPQLVRGLPVIEIGCGLGITAAAAIMVGGDLTATDYSPHSLLLTELTCLLAGQRAPEVRQINWRATNADLLQRSGERWPIVLAADVLYEARDIEPVLAALDRIVAPHGLVLLAEPGRVHAQSAIALARRRGWEIVSSVHNGRWPGGEDGTVHVHKMMKPAPAD